MRKSISNKQNIVPSSDLRLSLKMADKRKCLDPNQGRMSMLPLKRQRLSIAVENSLTQSRPTKLATNINILNTSNTNLSEITSMCQKSIRKEVIINNLVNKLDEQEEIRSIIQTKLRKNNYSTNKQFTYTSQFQPFSNYSLKNSQRTLIQQTPFPESSIQASQKAYLSTKVKDCQGQIQSLKQIIFQMNEKMNRMQNQATNRQTSDKISQNIKPTRSCSQRPQLSLSQDPKSTFFCSCSTLKKQTKSISIQANVEQHQNECRNFSQTDFFDNLQRTLKILDKNKQKCVEKSPRKKGV